MLSEVIVLEDRETLPRTRGMLSIRQPQAAGNPRLHSHRRRRDFAILLHSLLGLVGANWRCTGCGWIFFAEIQQDMEVAYVCQNDLCQSPTLSQRSASFVYEE